MCLVIVTLRLLAWATLTLIASATIFASITTPQWLIGPPTRSVLTSSRKNHTQQDISGETFLREHYYLHSDFYQPSLGIFNRCTWINGRLNCASFISRQGESFGNSDHFPVAWQASLVFFSVGLCFLVLTLLASILGWCFRSIRRKSIFSISGSVQALAVLLFILGLVIYPFGWNSTRVRRVCGEHADAFFLADCNLGWAFYVAVGGILLTCFAAVFSIQAEVSTSSNKVQSKILDGNKIICLP